MFNLKEKTKKCMDKLKGNWQGPLGSVLKGTAAVIDIGINLSISISLCINLNFKLGDFLVLGLLLLL